VRWRLTPSRQRPGWLTLIGPRDDAFKSELMAKVPRSRREYVPRPLGVWRIHASEQRTVEALIVLHSPEAELFQPTVEDVAALAVEVDGEPGEPDDLRDALALALPGREVSSVTCREVDGELMLVAVLGREESDRHPD